MFYVERLCKEISNYRENLGFLPRLLFFSSPCLWFLENFLRPVKALVRIQLLFIVMCIDVLYQL
jgi:ABC-type polysaccharide/polyol phosphate export permease